jgi:Ca2+-binding RTX toxin-like protein
VVTDFDGVADYIAVSAGGFGGGLAAGSLAGIRLVNAAGHAATEAFGQFLYDTAEQALYWDADGTGGAAAVKIATFNGLASLAAGNFFVEA